MLILLNEIDMVKTGIYKITNPVNNEIYIGSAANGLKKRFWQHKRLLKLNKNPCKYLQRVYNKNSNVDFVFEILEFCSKEDCIKKEQYYIDTLNPKYNLCRIAGSSLGRKQTKESIKNQFEAQKVYTDQEVILMFEMYNRGVSVKKIAEFLNCKANNISCIINKHHKYILVKEKYNLVVKNKKTYYSGRFLITKPNGEEIIVQNLTKYAKENGLEASNLNRCSNGIIKSAKGYKVAKID
jgi:group I intron endonuclease